MNKTRAFTDLIVWQKAHQFVLSVYNETKKFPKEEIHGLTSQFRRAAVSIAANIAEGFKKRGKKDKLNYLNISHGSLDECRYYITLSKDLGYCNDVSLTPILEETSTLLTAYSNKILNS